jgi:hypothetical protein
VGPRELNIELRRVSNGPMGAQYWTKEGVLWAHGSSILNYGRSPVGPGEFNIDQLRESSGPMGAQY